MACVEDIGQRVDDDVQQLGQRPVLNELGGQIEQPSDQQAALSCRGSGRVHARHHPGDRQHDDHVDAQSRPVLARADIQGQIGRDEEEVVDQEAADGTERTREEPACGDADDDRHDQHQSRGRDAQMRPQRQHGEGEHGHAGQGGQRPCQFAARGLGREGSSRVLYSAAGHRLFPTGHPATRSSPTVFPGRARSSGRHSLRRRPADVRSVRCRDRGAGEDVNVDTGVAREARKTPDRGTSGEQMQPAAAAAGAEHDVCGPCSAAARTIARAGSSSSISIQVPPDCSVSCLIDSSATVRCRPRTSLGRTCTTYRSAARPAAMRPARRHTVSVPGSSVTPTRTRSAAPGTAGRGAAQLIERSVIGLTGQEAQGEIAQRGEVPGLEEAVECRVNAFCRVDVAVQHPPAQLLGRRIDQLDLIGPDQHRVGDAFAHPGAGDRLDGVGQALDVLGVEGADHADVGVQQLEDVLPALLVPPGAGHVRMGELVDEHQLGSAGEDRVEIHLGEPGAPVGDRLRRHHLQAIEPGRRGRAVVGLHDPGHDVTAACSPAGGLVEHRVGLADPDAMPR